MILTILLFLSWLKHKAQSKIVRLCLCSGDKREDCCIKRETLDTIGNVNELLSKLNVEAKSPCKEMPFRRFRLCVCRENMQDKCRIDRGTVKLFSSLDEIDASLKPLGLSENGVNIKSDKSAKPVFAWKKRECELYYILVYGENGKRIYEHEVIAHPDETSHEFPEGTADMQIRILRLFRTNSEHGFVDVCEASYLIKPYKMVIDLSPQSSRPARRSPTHFGFLCDSKYNFDKRVAAKQILFEKGDPSNQNHTEIVPKKASEQIELALDAGGQFNIKFLACTGVEIGENVKYVWMAMELCIRTFDHLIRKPKENDSIFLIDHHKMKICFTHIMQGLIHLHNNSNKPIRHGEMIPENILLTQTGENLKIAEYEYASDKIDVQEVATKAVSDGISVSDKKWMSSLPSPETDKFMMKGIGKESDKIKQNLQDDVRMTAYMFYRCLIRDKKTKTHAYDKKSESSLPPEGLMKKRIDELLCLIHDESNSKKSLETQISELFRESLSPSSGKGQFTCSWIDLLRTLAMRIKGSAKIQSSESSKFGNANLEDFSSNSESEDAGYGTSKTENSNPRQSNSTPAEENTSRDHVKSEEPVDDSSNPESYLSAYLIMHMILDRPKAKEVLNHPFFWDEFKILSFLIRMDGYFYERGDTEELNKQKQSNEAMVSNEKTVTDTETFEETANKSEILQESKSADISEAESHKTTKSDLLTSMKGIFTDAYKKLQPDWSPLYDKLKEICEKTVIKAKTKKEHEENVKKVLKQMMSRAPKDEKHTVLKLLHYIRNTHAHYHAPVSDDKYNILKDKDGNTLKINSFESTAKVWEFFNGLYPEMICLLHRVVWMEWIKNKNLPFDDLDHFVTEPKYVKTLGLGKISY